MTAPRLDLGELRRLVDAQMLDGCDPLTGEQEEMVLCAFPALLSIAEAAEAALLYFEQAYGNLECDHDVGCCCCTERRMADALRAALAAVRKEEKGE